MSFGNLENLKVQRLIVQLFVTSVQKQKSKVIKLNTKMFPKILNLLALVILLLLFLATRKSLCLVNPLHTEYYANYRSHPDDDEFNYKFHYFIDHAPTKVHMMHLEERQGDKVRGQYGLLEPNGMVRMVHYQVEGDSGFQSVVQTRTPHSTTHIRLVNRNQPKLPLILQQPVATVI